MFFVIVFVVADWFPLFSCAVSQRGAVVPPGLAAAVCRLAYRFKCRVVEAARFKCVPGLIAMFVMDLSNAAIIGLACTVSVMSPAC